MPLNSILVRIFVSCPGDVTPEKEIVKGVCESINDGFFRTGCGVHFVVHDWRNIVGEVGPRPQGQINANVAGYDIYLGLFWMRYGSPTGRQNPETGEDFGSGTVEEFYEAYGRWQNAPDTIKIYVFFKNPNSSASNDLAAHEQMGRVLNFRTVVERLGWANRFVGEGDFRDAVRNVLEVYGRQLWDKQREIEVEAIREHAQRVSATVQIDPKDAEPEFTPGLLKAFVKDVERVAHHIPRSVSEAEGEARQVIRLFSNEASNKTLAEEILQRDRIVLLGNAGSGKSVELQQAAISFQQPQSSLIPIYKRFNTYVNQDIEQFLPEGWESVEASLLVILLDGLDEILPEHRNTAIRKLLDFTGKRPEIKIVVSSRTNFYSIPKDGVSGTLPGFECFYLDDLSTSRVGEYLKTVHNADGDRFVQEAYNEGFIDLIQKPFFLNILVNKFLKDGNLRGGRGQIFEDFFVEKLNKDIEHFRATFPLEDRKHHAIEQLQRIALVMENLGRNYLEDEEMSRIVSGETYSQLKYYTALVRKDGERGIIWMFEHNNIQEYLAARALSRQSFERVQELISVGVDSKQIKPTWVNTLSFWVSIAGEAEVTKLLDWVIDIDGEVAVKFEVDRIPFATRLDIFRRIFNFYKGKDIWIHSNKFRGAELVRFAQSDELIRFLIDEASSVSTSRRTLLNAINLLDDVDVSYFSTQHLEELQVLLLHLLESHQGDNSIVQNVLYTMAKLEINDGPIIDRVLSQFGKRQNQYIRAGLYRLINSSGRVDDYVSYYLEGMTMADYDYKHEDREETHLVDESWFVRDGLMQIQRTDALKEVFYFLGKSKTGRRFENYELPDVLKTLVPRAAHAYQADDSLYNAVFYCFKTVAGMHHNHLAALLQLFFRQTNTSIRAFLDVWSDTEMESYQKTSFLAYLINDSVIDHFIQAYDKRDYNNKEAKEFHFAVRWNSRNTTGDATLLTKLEKALQEIGGLDLASPPPVDTTERDKERLKDSFSLLFDYKKLKEEVDRIIEAIGKPEFTFRDLWESARTGWQSEEYFAESARGLIRDFTTHGRMTTKETLDQWFSRNAKVEAWAVNEIYDAIQNRSAPELEAGQFNALQDWVKRTAANTDVAHAARPKDEHGSVTINMNAVRLWNFIKRFRFSVPEEKLLDFTLIYDHEDFQNKDTSSILQRIEEFVGQEKLQSRVLQNLENGIDVGWVWRNNSLYAIANQLRKSYSFILRDLQDAQRSVYDRGDVLKAYYAKTNDEHSLFELLGRLQTDELRWTVVKQLLPDAKNKERLAACLKQVLSDDTEAQSERLYAAKSLMKLGELSGLQSYTERLEQLDHPDEDFIDREDLFSGIQTIEALPLLIRILTVSRKPNFLADRFHNLHGIVMGALHRIALISEDNLHHITGTLRQFIADHSSELENLNFMEYSIREMEEQFYTNQAKSLSIDAAAKQVDSILLN